MKRLTIGVVTLAMALLLASPRGVVAQDCGTVCVECGTPFETLYEGAVYNPDGENDMSCPGTVGTGCESCKFSVSSGKHDREAIARAVLTSSMQELPTLIAAYGSRLLLSESRDLVAVVGNDCNDAALGVWLVVSREKMAALRRLDLASYEGAAAWAP